MKSDLVIRIRLVSQAKSDSIKEPLIIGTLMDDIEIIAEKLRFAVNNAKNDEPMQIRNIYNKMQAIRSKSASHKSIVLDLPLTFNSAIKTVQQSGSTITVRPHAVTVSEVKVTSISSVPIIMQQKHRQRGESAPPKATITMERKSLVAVPEPPKPYVDRK
jgi:hypothetical protein